MRAVFLSLLLLAISLTLVNSGRLLSRQVLNGQSRRSSQGMGSLGGGAGSVSAIPQVEHPKIRKEFKAEVSGGSSSNSALYLSPASIGLDHAVESQAQGHHLHLPGNEPVSRKFPENSVKLLLAKLDGKQGYAFLNTSGELNQTTLKSDGVFNWAEGKEPREARYLALVAAQAEWTAQDEKNVVDFANRNPALRVVIAAPVSGNPAMTGSQRNNIFLFNKGSKGEVHLVYPEGLGPNQRDFAKLSNSAKQTVQKILQNSDPTL